MKVISVIVSSVGICLTASVYASDETPWSYSGLTKPAYWGKLSPDYSLCSSGKEQSPINLNRFTNTDLPEITFNYTDSGNQIENNGHVIEINNKPGSSINIDSHVYELIQTQFHTPGEHTINGKHFPMEAQLIHKDKSGRTLIIAVLFEYGDDNSALHHDWMYLLYKKHTKHLLYKKINAMELLPDIKDYYQYDGSLTTPPCTENIQWLVMKQPAGATKEQIETLRNTIHSENNRPLQAINMRTIFE